MMTHNLIQIKDISLAFPHKTCFDNFSCRIPYGSRIAIIGRNGAGKSSLLKIIAEYCKHETVIGYVPQLILEHNELSGGQRFNQALTNALSLNPSMLFLDEPTNHLDSRNRKSLIRMLQHYSGTLIIVSHDKELLRHCTETLFHIENSHVHIFSGFYDDYIREIKLKRASIERELALLNREKKNTHHQLMKEQQRAKKSKLKGEKSIVERKWPTIVSKSKALKAQENTGRRQSAIDKRKSDLVESLDNLRLPEIITPTFSIGHFEIGNGTLVNISNGAVGYVKDNLFISGVTLHLQGGERLAIRGNNGSGKSTLIKAILGDEKVYKVGEWTITKRENIGYLDQHYNTLPLNKSVLEIIADSMPHWTHAEIRRHLNDFLFRKNEEVTARVNTLSGGEKARLSLAQIAAKTPKLLILDEITNNLDIETIAHVVQILKAYPGGIIVISHDEDFLASIGVNDYFEVSNDV